MLKVVDSTAQELGEAASGNHGNMHVRTARRFLDLWMDNSSSQAGGRRSGGSDRVLGLRRLVELSPRFAQSTRFEVCRIPIFLADQSQSDMALLWNQKRGGWNLVGREYLVIPESRGYHMKER